MPTAGNFHLSCRIALLEALRPMRDGRMRKVSRDTLWSKRWCKICGSWRKSRVQRVRIDLVSWPLFTGFSNWIVTGSHRLTRRNGQKVDAESFRQSNGLTLEWQHNDYQAIVRRLARYRSSISSLQSGIAPITMTKREAQRPFVFRLFSDVPIFLLTCLFNILRLLA